MDKHWISLLKAALLLIFINLAECLKCFKCDNHDQAECGGNYVKQNYHSIECKGRGPFKCGLQIQPPNADGWVGKVRNCYQSGTLKINESNGCHPLVLDNAENLVGKFCLCDTDECNDRDRSSVTSTASVLPFSNASCIFMLSVVVFFSS